MSKYKLSTKRKIISINYSYLISLPKDWLDFFKLNKGDEVMITSNNRGELIVLPIKNEAQKITK